MKFLLVILFAFTVVTQTSEAEAKSKRFGSKPMIRLIKKAQYKRLSKKKRAAYIKGVHTSLMKTEARMRKRGMQYGLQTPPTPFSLFERAYAEDLKHCIIGGVGRHMAQHSDGRWLCPTYGRACEGQKDGFECGAIYGKACISRLNAEKKITDISKRCHEANPEFTPSLEEFNQIKSDLESAYDTFCASNASRDPCTYLSQQMARLNETYAPPTEVAEPTSPPASTPPAQEPEKPPIFSAEGKSCSVQALTKGCQDETAIESDLVERLANSGANLDSQTSAIPGGLRNRMGSMSKELDKIKAFLNSAKNSKTNKKTLKRLNGIQLADSGSQRYKNFCALGGHSTFDLETNSVILCPVVLSAPDEVAVEHLARAASYAVGPCAISTDLYARNDKEIKSELALATTTAQRAAANLNRWALKLNKADGEVVFNYKDRKTDKARNTCNNLESYYRLINYRDNPDIKFSTYGKIGRQAHDRVTYSPYDKVLSCLVSQQGAKAVERSANPTADLINLHGERRKHNLSLEVPPKGASPELFKPFCEARKEDALVRRMIKNNKPTKGSSMCAGSSTGDQRQDSFQNLVARDYMDVYYKSKSPSLEGLKYNLTLACLNGGTRNGKVSAEQRVNGLLSSRHMAKAFKCNPTQPSCSFQFDDVEPRGGTRSRSSGSNK